MKDLLPKWWSIVVWCVVLIIYKVYL